MITASPRYLFGLLVMLIGLSPVVAQPPGAVPTPPPPVFMPLEDLPDLDAPPPPPEIIPEPEPEPLPKIWSGEFEFGLTGSEGNSKNFKLRFGSKLKRETKRTRFNLDALYRIATLNGVQSEDRLFVTDKFEWLFKNSPMNLFFSGTTEYDRFKAFDVRIARHTGFGYDIIKNDITTLTSRFGGGFSREIGGPENKFVPELQFGADFEHKVTNSQKLIMSFDYFPDVSDFGDYRFQGKITYEFLIDPEWGLTLRFGILNLFDSTPELGRKRNDLDYFATILWKY